MSRDIGVGKRKVIIDSNFKEIYNMTVKLPLAVMTFLFLSFIITGYSKSEVLNHNKRNDSNLETVREKLLLDPGWKFHLGDASSPDGDFGFGLDKVFAKAGETSGPGAPDFNDSTWRTIDLPHDWAIELDFVNSDNGVLDSHGYKPIGRQFPKTSIGWYRRSLEIPKTDEGKRITIKFDGVFRDCMVWLNGHFLGRNLSGYNEFDFDVSDYLNYGGKNVLVVRADATLAEGWFYEGAGIYRHVWLIKTAPLHIPLYGTYVTTDVEKNSAFINISTKIFNRDEKINECNLISVILDDKGNEIGKSSSENLCLNNYEEKTISQKIKLENPHLWSLNDPYLYKVVQYIKSGENVIDNTETNIGVRTIKFDKDNGFFLNGERVEIKGTCNHQDHAGVGSALPDGLQYYRIEKLKEMGCNAYRTSHNPPTPELLDACDKLGMLVMDENRLLGSTKEFESQFTKLILRDRNHPSVIIWSIGNEEFTVEGNDVGKRIAESLIRIQKKYDPSRLSTFAADNGGTFEGINSIIPVRGFNYRINSIDQYRQDHPDRILWGSEMASTLATRGEYAKDTVKGYVSDYDLNAPPWGETAEDWWKFFDARKWLAGGFVWTGFDYRGEPTPYRWPCINSHFGIMDVCGFPKNNFYYYQSWWSNKDILHIFPHWNWKGKEGQPIDIWCYSSCDSVELFLNGESLGKKTMEKDFHLEWNATYQPGTLEATGWRNGKLITTKVETTGEPASIQLIANRITINADGEDVSIITVTALDSQGREVPVADNFIHFEIEGAGKIIGVGNGDPSSHEKDKYIDGGYQRKLFNGKCSVIILSDRKAGSIKLKASSENLKPAEVIINTVTSTLIPLAGK
ncbi:MAG: beta-galactosidase GalA [Ignavibacteriaceae bacterium]|jgi:beta-galactosidase